MQRQRLTNLAVIGAIAIGAIVILTQARNSTPLSGQNLLNLLVFALPLAGIYAMAASGLVVVYTTTGIFNFAQGAIGMLMAYVYWQMHVAWEWPTLVSFVLTAFVIAPLLGWLLDAAIMRRLGQCSEVVKIMVTVGLLFGFIGIANSIWDQNRGRAMPTFFGDEGFRIGDVLLTWHRFITLVVAVVLAVGLRILLYRTRLGVAMRAVVDNRSLAALNGARPNMVSSVAWAMGCSLAAISGILIAPEAAMATSGLLTLVVIFAFAAAVIGRLRSLPMTYVGALILALIETFSKNFLSLTGQWSGVPLVIPTIVLFVVLLLMPQANLRFSRINAVRRTERVASIRDTIIGAVALFVVMFIISSFLDNANLSRLSFAMATALVALSLVPLIGFAGQISLAPLAFASIGAVAYVRLGGETGNGWWVFAAAAIAVPVGVVMALPALRLQGLYLALLTVAFAYMMEIVILNQPWAFNGISMPAQRLSILGIDFSDTRRYLLLLTAVFGLCGLGVVALRRSPVGRRLIALRDSEAACATVGINVLETKVGVFALSAGMSGFAGAFLAMHYETVSSQNFPMLAGLPIVFQLVIGGVAAVSGALFAGIFPYVLGLTATYWKTTFWLVMERVGPGFATLGIIQNPSGAVVPMSDDLAPLVPWRADARAAKAQRKAREALHEDGRLGLTDPFTPEAVARIERSLGVVDELAQERP